MRGNYCAILAEGRSPFIYFKCTFAEIGRLSYGFLCLQCHSLLPVQVKLSDAVFYFDGAVSATGKIENSVAIFENSD